MPKSASVRVVIPTYNCGSYVVEAIESVLNQTVSPATIIVVDDGSSDGTRDRLARFGSRIHYLFQQNQGVAVARNAGMRNADEKFIAFLDADDVWHPRKLEIQLRAMASRPACGMLGTGTFDWPCASMPEIDPEIRETVVRVPWESLAVKNAFTTSTVVIRREVLARAGEFDRELRGPEDYDLWLRLAEIAEVANIDFPLAGYRMVAGSLGKQARSMEQGMRRILLKLDERQAWSGRWLLRRKAHSYCDYSCAFMYRAAGDRRTATRRLISSFAWFPWPYHAHEVRVPLARPRLLATTVMRKGSS